MIELSDPVATQNRRSTRGLIAFLPVATAVLMFSALLADQQRANASGRSVDGSPTPPSETPTATLASGEPTHTPTLTSTAGPYPIQPTATASASGTPATVSPSPTPAYKVFLPLVVRDSASALSLTYFPLVIREF